MTDIQYIVDYIGGLRVALEDERNLWQPEQFTQNLCILNVLDSITNEIVKLDEKIKHLQPSGPSEEKEA